MSQNAVVVSFWNVKIFCFSLFCITANWISLGSGLEDVTSGCGKLQQATINWENHQPWSLYGKNMTKLSLLPAHWVMFLLWGFAAEWNLRGPFLRAAVTHLQLGLSNRSGLSALGARERPQTGNVAGSLTLCQTTRWITSICLHIMQITLSYLSVNQRTSATVTHYVRCAPYMDSYPDWINTQNKLNFRYFNSVTDGYSMFSNNAHSSLNPIHCSSTALRIE